MTTNSTFITKPSICSPCRVLSRTSMSYARGLLTPVLVTLVGVGTGQQTLSPPVSKNRQLTVCPGIAIFDPAFKQEKEQKEQEQYVYSHVKSLLPTMYQHNTSQNCRVQGAARPCARRADSQDRGGGSKCWRGYHNIQGYGEVV